MEETRIRFKNIGSAINHAFYHGGWIASNYFISAGNIFNVWYSPCNIHTMSFIFNDIRDNDFEVGSYGHYRDKINNTK